MGNSLPPPAGFDLVGSFARRRGPDVEIVLSKPTNKISESATVTLRKGQTSVTAAAQFAQGAAGPALTVRTPRAELTNGQWSLTLHTGPDTNEKLEARLLVQGERPIVLLWGARGFNSIKPEPRRSNDPKRRAAAKAGVVLDRALRLLPEAQAKKVRAQARSTARRVLR